jgi:hypothetical protein
MWSGAIGRRRVGADGESAVTPQPVDADGAGPPGRGRRTSSGLAGLVRLVWLVGSALCPEEAENSV